MLDAISGVRSLFNAIISLFSSVFSFLPSWVLLFVGSAVVFAIGIFIYKLVRG